jgi:hypothetical protein
MGTSAVMLDIGILPRTVRLTKRVEAPPGRFRIDPERLGARNPLQLLFAQVHAANVRLEVERAIRAKSEPESVATTGSTLRHS